MLRSTIYFFDTTEPNYYLHCYCGIGASFFCFWRSAESNMSERTNPADFTSLHFKMLCSCQALTNPAGPFCDMLPLTCHFTVWTYLDQTVSERNQCFSVGCCVRSSKYLNRRTAHRWRPHSSSGDLCVSVGGSSPLIHQAFQVYQIAWGWFFISRERLVTFPLLHLYFMRS